jgi:methionine-rich copper-binding protein CopC
MELRLLTDPAFGEDFDTVVDEITDQYVGNELQSEERKRVEQYFLRSPERQNKVRFASELARQAALARGGKVVNIPIRDESGWWERASDFWNRQALSLRFASIFATLVIFAGVAMLVMPTRNPPTYASIALQMSNSDRSVGSEIPSVKPQPNDAGIRMELTIPDGAPQGNTYRVNLTGEQGARDLPVAEQNARTVVVVVPTADVPPGSYTIQLFAVNADGSEQRIRGSYFFNVQ